MNKSLNEPEIQYVISHLDLIMDTKILSERIHYKYNADVSNQIIFIPHTGDLTISIINDLPVLFAADDKAIYSIDNDGNLVFHQDLLKSAFYLLSGYDEHFVNAERDHWGRVKYDGSIQKKLNIIERPIVNEYFDLILAGVNAFLKHHGKPLLAKRKIFESFGFLLSHDIDVIDKYGWPHLGYKIKELLGLAKSTYSKVKIIKATLLSAFQFINPWRANPYWNFDYLLRLEQKHRIKASYFFLAKNKTGDSRYQFDEKRLITLFETLKTHGHEIGIHGTTPTAGDAQLLAKEIRWLKENADVNISGGRQHRLWLDLPLTFKNHEKVGLMYDSSYGFAEHEGFRNSFCLPFKPYDFQNQKSIDVWQFPLMAMDVTLFHYRNLDRKTMLDSIQSMLDAVKKHHGIFTLLWHNSFFDETLYPGVTEIYETILALVSDQQPVALTGKTLVELLDEHEL
ncbi:polysaccharide deacetylase family protein [Ekhidna sp.]|uniref:polysaccharide deacetylase family protein n=1 Tax=Ekhidna sp. TaxID=2608089 RepID=UPI003B50EF37